METRGLRGLAAASGELRFRGHVGGDVGRPGKGGWGDSFGGAPGGAFGYGVGSSFAGGGGIAGRRGAAKDDLGCGAAVVAASAGEPSGGTGADGEGAVGK